jgi:hypothetical protein
VSASDATLALMVEETELQGIERDVFADWSSPPRDLVEQIGILVGQWPVDAFAREKLDGQKRALVWVRGRAIGLSHYTADDVAKQEIVATIRPASQVVGVDIKTHVFDDRFRKSYRRTAVVRFATGDPITVDTSKYVHDGLREQAEKFIDNVLDALTKAP